MHYRKNTVYTYVFISLIILFYSCKHTKKQRLSQPNLISVIQYAQTFDIQEFDSYKKLTIFKTPSKREATVYYLIPKNTPVPDSLKNKSIIRTPVERMVLTSTTQIPMLEMLNSEGVLVGFPNPAYISSEKTRKRIAQGKITDLGQNQQINTELLLSIHPELFVGFSVKPNSEIYDNIRKLGIPVILNQDWMEETPLGKAEYLLFFGALFEKDALAKQHFTQIAQQYNHIKKQVKNSVSKPTILSGSLYQDVWYLPAGESYMAQFFKDAGGDYLWKDTQGSGSLSLSYESVLEKAQNADYWIAPGFYRSKQKMIHDNPFYKDFIAFQKDKIYTYASKTGTTGGVLFFELATTHPDWVLEDFVQILHPEKFSHRPFHFFSKLED